MGGGRDDAGGGAGARATGGAGAGTRTIGGVGARATTRDGLVVSPAPVPNYGIDADRVLERDGLVDAARRRWDGRYAVDEFGGDPHLQDLLLVPVAGRVPVRVHDGARLPRSGPALLIANRGLGLVEPIVLAGAVQRETGRRLRIAGLANPPLVSMLAHKLGGISRRAGDVAAVLRAGHLAAAPLARSWSVIGTGEAPRALIAATLGFPLLPVAILPEGPAGVPLRGWSVRVGETLAPAEGAEAGDPLAAAELSEAVRSSISDLLCDARTPGDPLSGDGAAGLGSRDLGSRDLGSRDEGSRDVGSGA